jgi:EmrB/QacA subfamily drug resistance transporter
MDSTATRPGQGLTRPRPGAVVQYALLAGPLLSMLDSSIVNVAIEPIARGLGAPLDVVQWAVSGYLLALGTGLAGTAYLARRYGTLPVYRASLIGFTVASGACALAPDAGGLIATRVVQGLVAAPLVPLAMSMLLGSGGNARSVSPVAGILLFAGPALGPTAGGALIGAGGWRAIFAINVPLGVLAIWCQSRVPASVAPGRSGQTEFDLRGLVLLAGGLAGLLYGVTEGTAVSWTATRAQAPLAAGAALLAGYVWWAGRSPHPALDLSLARRRVPFLAMALSAMASVVTWAAVFVLPVFAQTAQRHSALAAGLALAPQGVITGLSTAFGPRLLGRVSLRVIVGGGFALLAGASLGLLAIGIGTPLWVIAVILSGRSMSIGLVINPLLTAVTGPLAPEQMADASTLFNVWQRVAGSFGIGLIAALYSATARVRGPVAALHQTGDVVAAVAGAGVLLALALPSRAAMDGHT